MALTEHCPHCKKNNVRHSANFVVPGWCTACHHFLGLQELETPPLLDEKELERTQEIENLLMLFSEPGLSTDLSILHKAIETLIQKLDNDVNAHFAKRIGVQKSSVHYWRSKQSTLTFEALLQIAMRCNISIVKLIQGDLSCWIPIGTPVERKNTKSQLSFSHTKNSTSHDWNKIRHYLQQELNRQNTPRSVAEIARELGISKRSLYIQARKETGLLGQRYLHYRQEQGKRNLVECHEILTNACKYVRKQGHGISARRITPIVDAEILRKTPAFYSMLSQIAQEIELRA